MKEKLKFEYENGLSVEFERFDDVQNHKQYAAMGAYQPNKKGDGSDGTVYLWVPTAFVEYYRKLASYGYRPTEDDYKKVYGPHVGILQAKMSVGVPRGAYVPFFVSRDYLYNQTKTKNHFTYVQAQIILDGLKNDVLLYEEYLLVDTMKKQLGLLEEAEEEAQAVAQ